MATEKKKSIRYVKNSVCTLELKEDYYIGDGISVDSGFVCCLIGWLPDKIKISSTLGGYTRVGSRPYFNIPSACFLPHSVDVKITAIGDDNE